LNDTGNHTEGQKFGIVPGFVYYPNAIDVWDGHLRVLSTSYYQWQNLNKKYCCFWERIPIEIRSKSQPHNDFISILNISTEKKLKSMERVGFISNFLPAVTKYGIPYQWSVQFLKAKAYLGAVFEKSHMYWLIDLRLHDAPKVLTRLKDITFGRNNYFHRVDDDNAILVSKGYFKEAEYNDPDITQGLQISYLSLNTTDNSLISSRSTTYYNSCFYGMTCTSYVMDSHRFFME